MIVGALAAAITTGALILGNPGGDGTPRRAIPGLYVPAAKAQTVLNNAAQAALRRPFTAPRPDQWIYIATRYRHLDKPGPGDVQSARTAVFWGWLWMPFARGDRLIRPHSHHAVGARRRAAGP
jgi:hypothetical protein